MISPEDLKELEDVIINAITPAYTALDILISGHEIDVLKLKTAKERLYKVREYITGLRYA